MARVRSQQNTARLTKLGLTVEKNTRNQTKFPRCDTVLADWLTEHDVSTGWLANRVGVTNRTAWLWARGQCLPAIVAAFRIEQVTQGGVPVESWLGCETGRLDYERLEARAAQLTTPGRHYQQRMKARTPEEKRAIWTRENAIKRRKKQARKAEKSRAVALLGGTP